MAPTMIALLRLNAFSASLRICCADLDLRLQQCIAAGVELLVRRPRALDQRALGAVERAGLRCLQRFLHET